MFKPGPLTHLCVLLAFALLVGLGVWQLQRLQWKRGVLARVEALRAAPPQPIGPVLIRARQGEDVGFTRVAAPCPDLERSPVLRLYGLHRGQAGYRLISACLLPAGPYPTLLVDRGFIPLDQPMPAAGAPLARPATGILRAPDSRTMVTPANTPEQNLWYWRDLPGMAAALGAPAPAPVMLMLEGPAPARGWPLPAPLPAEIRNPHLGYAITWFGLAAALAGVYLAMLFRKRQD